MPMTSLAATLMAWSSFHWTPTPMPKFLACAFIYHKPVPPGYATVWFAFRLGFKRKVSFEASHIRINSAAE